MLDAMDCTLFIPHLIPSLEQGEPPWRAPEAPRLKTLLARATHAIDNTTDAEAWLCGAFGIARQRDWPLAPICAAADGLPAHGGYWLRATPVHLEPRRTALMLTGSAASGLTATVSDALALSLSTHLRDEGITLHAPRPGVWYLSAPQAQTMQTFAIEAALGRDVREFLPQGADSLRWHRIITEMQMLLHAHPVNESREAQGQPAINSVWISGGGTLPPRSAARYTHVCGDDDVVHALAQHSGGKIASRVHAFDQLSASGHLLVTIESLALRATRGDMDAWRDAVHALEREWIIPLLAAQKSRRIGTITLVSANGEGVQQFILHSLDFLKIWRKNKYL